MERQDAKRAVANEALTDKDEVIALAQKEERKLLSFEAEMRAASVEPEPRPEERVKPTNAHHPATVDHKWRPPNTRLAAQEGLLARSPNDGGPKVRLCHKCQKPRHLVRNCPDGRAGPCAPRDKGDNLSAHKIPCHVCEVYKKTGHNNAQGDASTW